MKRFLLLAVSVLFALNVYAQESGKPPFTSATWQLFTDCGKVGLLVNTENAGVIPFPEEERAIETLVRNRFRAAPIYDPKERTQFLNVTVNESDGEFGISVQFWKILCDPLSDMCLGATLWNTGSTGTWDYDWQKKFLLQILSQHIDHFINEYLRVNADYCE